MDVSTGGSPCFENADLQISNIRTVYYAEQSDWKRDKPFPRYASGLIWVTGGSITYHFPEGSFTSHPGDFLKFGCGVPYWGVSQSSRNSYFVVDFDTMPEDSLERFPLGRVTRPSRPGEVHAALSHMCSLWNSTAPDRLLACRAALYALLSDLMREYYLTQSTHRENRLIGEAVDYIHANLSSPQLTIERIASQVHISPSQLRRTFSRVLGQAPMDYLQSERLQRATDLLRYGSLPIGRVAELCGFSSPYYFSRWFGERTGRTPSDFRMFC